MITLVFSLSGPVMTDAQTSAFAEYAQWRVVNERNGRLLVDGIGQLDDMQRALDALTQMGRDPIVIGAWYEDGSPVAGYDLNESVWLDVAPPEWDVTNPDKPVAVYPTAWKDIHRWAGWAEKRI